MKLTRKMLKEFVKKELREISGTTGGTAAIKRQKAAKAGVAKMTATRGTKKTAYDTSKSTYKTKSSSADSKKAVYNTKLSDLNAFSQQKYRKANRAARGGYDYSSNPIKGGQLNPAWTTKNNAKSAALSDKTAAETEKTSAETDRDTKEREYNRAVKDLSAAEKGERASKASTGFGFGSGGGGRGAGKAGTAKGKGKGKGKGKKGKDESLFRILGRDLINEIDGIETSLKHQKKLHKK